MNNDALIKYKESQKIEMMNKIQEAIESLKASNTKVSVANIAKLVGVSRANLYAHYKDTIQKFSNTGTLDKVKKQGKSIEIQEDTLQRLKKENKELKDINNKLIDQLVAMKVLAEKMA